MGKSLAAQMRRMQRMMRPAKLSKKSQSILIGAAFNPLGVVTTKRRKSPAKSAVLTTSRVAKTTRSTEPVAASKTHKSGLNIPHGAQYLSRRHRCVQGSRGYKLYLPASATAKPKGLIVMLHGCKQDPDDFAIGTHMNAQAEKHGLAVVYPAQSRTHNPAGCWNWFASRHQQRGMGEAEILASMTRKLAREFGIGRDHVYVAGLSAGGAMAAILVDVYPDVFAAAGIHSGLARGAARDVPSAMAAMRRGAAGHAMAHTDARAVGRIIFQGDADSTVHPSNAAHLVASARGEGAEAHRVTRKPLSKISYTRSEFVASGQHGPLEVWILEGAGHAWSRGRVAGSFTDPKGPDASAQMVRFFLATSR